MIRQNTIFAHSMDLHGKIHHFIGLIKSLNRVNEVVFVNKVNKVLEKCNVKWGDHR